MLIADNGVIIRTAIDQISSLSRVSQGVRLMRLKGDTKIVGVALTAKESDNGAPQEENAETLNEEENDSTPSEEMLIETESSEVQTEEE